ncbi:MAG: sugar phosphate nucleotidyltransferase [Candidatus Tectomicrobia bacterium]|jgi:glucose-1-phosphate thymidylyltransferase|nr:sugar phosphate nucleotidyltransferase [Candidatus Tectomicrobia bacterium]
MKVIVPVAGKGTRLRPHTHTKPKSLVRVAGKPILGHLIDRLRSLSMEELILVIDPDEAKEASIREFLETTAPVPVRYVRQTELKGPAHAIFLAREHIDGDVLIVFNDTLFDADLSQIERHQGDGLIWVREVEDPRRFGLVELKDNRIVRLVEKPEVPPSNLAMIGMYYLKDGPGLMARIDRVMREGRTVKGEFYLPDPLQLMLDEGYRIEAAPVQGWYDCGTIEALLDTNRVLLENGHQKVSATSDSVIIPPVCIEEGAHIRRSVVGPYVSVASGAAIENSIIHDSIINAGASVQDTLLQRSLIGEHAIVKGGYKRLNVGDSSAVQGG